MRHCLLGRVSLARYGCQGLGVGCSLTSRSHPLLLPPRSDASEQGLLGTVPAQQPEGQRPEVSKDGPCLCMFP